MEAKLVSSKILEFPHIVTPVKVEQNTTTEHELQFFSSYFVSLFLHLTIACLVYYWFGQKPAPITYEKLITIDIISIPLQEAKEIATQNQFKSYTSLNTTLPSNEPEKREESEVQASIKHPSVTTIKIKKASITIKAKDLASYKIREQLPSNGQSTKRYEQIISQAIEKNISHLQLEKTQSSKVMFKIRLNKKGKVIISSLLESSGNVKIDQLLLNAVQKATYLPSVPQDYPGYAKESLFDFIIPIEIN